MTQTADSISVVLCTYSEERWNDLTIAVESVQQQTLQPEEIIIVIDHNPELLKRVREHISDVTVIENKQAKGLSGARNSGVMVAQSEIVAFLDDDAYASQNWIECLATSYMNPHVVGVGGKIEPQWPEEQPFWFPEEFNWVVGCSYRGLPTENAAVRNLLGANMSIRRDVITTVYGFRESFGWNRRKETRQTGFKLLAQQIGNEETELCIRTTHQLPESIWLYAPAASIQHRVSVPRTSWAYFLRRCYSEGQGKALLVSLHGSPKSLAAERSYTFHTLPQGILRGITDAFLHHDLTGLARSTAIILGLGTTIAGYLVGKTFQSAMVSDLQSPIATANVRGSL